MTIRLARDLRAPAIYLLTTTAEGYFLRFGFETIGRDEVSESVKASMEFTSACPSTAVAMRKVLRPLTTVLFACIHNAGRSQMAAAYFNALADPGQAQAISAGTKPGGQVHPGVVSAMQEVGFDLSEVAPQRLTMDLAQRADWLITVGCGDECPVVPGAAHQDWPIADPKDQSAETVRLIRDEVARRVWDLVHRESWRD